MSLPISSISQVVPITGLDGAASASSTGKSGGFASVLEGAIQGVEQTRSEANQAIQNLLTGENGELHNVALATQRAELAFELGLQVRNKIVAAYQEVMKMQL